MSDIDEMLAGKDSETAYKNLKVRMSSYANRGDTDAVFAFLKNCIIAYPKSAAVYCAFSDIFRDVSDSDIADEKDAAIREGINVLNDAIRFDSLFTSAYEARAFFLAKKKEYRKALDDYNMLIDKLKAGNPFTYFSRGRMHLELKNNREAVRDLRKCLELEPNCPPASEIRRLLKILPEAKGE